MSLSPFHHGICATSWHWLAGFACTLAIAHAQLGIAPSQTSTFLDELRARHALGQPDVLGEDRENLEAGRPELRSYLLRAGSTFASRYQEDNPFGTGQYQVGREFLNPWNQGLTAPVRTPRGIEGLEAGFVFEPMAGFNSLRRNSLGLGSADYYNGSAVGWLDVSATYALASNQRLTLDVGLGLDDHSSLILLPGSTLAYDLVIGPWVLTVYQTVTTPSVRPDNDFVVWQSDAGAAVTWQAGPEWTFTLDHHETVAETAAFFWAGGVPALQKRVTRSFNGVADWKPSAEWHGGLEAGYAWTEFDNFAQADGQQHRAGLFIERSFPAEAALLRVAAGYQSFDFDNSAGRTGLSAPYANLTFSQKLSSIFSHEASAGYESAINVFSFATNVSYANYGVTAAPWDGGRLTASGFLEHDEFMGLVRGVDLHLAQQISPRLTAALSMHYSRNGGNWDAYVYGATVDYALGQGRSVRIGCSHLLIGAYNLANVTAGLRIPF